MLARSNSIAKQLKYKVPRIKLCLVHECKDTQTYQVRTPEDAAEFLNPLKFAAEEYFVSLHVNSRHEIIGLHEVSHGTLSSSLVHPREVFKAALLSNSYAILVCHNHPSGSVIVPSAEDLETTAKLLEAGRILGVNVLDHLIISPSHNIYSLREHHSHLWNRDGECIA